MCLIENRAMEQHNKGNIILYQSADGTTNIEVTLANDTVWLTADQMAELFQRDRSTIQRHIKRIYQENELTPDSTCAFFAQVQAEGKRQVEQRNNDICHGESCGNKICPNRQVEQH